MIMNVIGIIRNGIMYILPMLLIKAMGIDSGSVIYKIAFVISFVFACLAFILRTETIQFKVFRCVMFVVFGITIIFSGEYSLLLLGGLFIALDIKLDSAVMNKLLCLTWWGGVASALLGLVLGLRDDQVIIFYRSAFDFVELKHTLGYSHANLFAATICIGLMLAGTVLKSINLKLVLIMCCVEAVAFYLSRGITALIVFSIFITLVMLLQSNLIHSRITGIIDLLSMGCLAPPVLVLICLFCYNPRYGVWRELNIWLSGRLYLMNQIRMVYPISVCGQIIESGTATQDMAFPHILYTFGLIPTLVIAFMYMISIIRWKKTQNTHYLIICFCFLVYGMAEQFFRNCFMNISLILVAFETLKWFDEVSGKWVIKEKPRYT